MSVFGTPLAVNWDVLILTRDGVLASVSFAKFGLHLVDLAFGDCLNAGFSTLCRQFVAVHCGGVSHVSAFFHPNCIVHRQADPSQKPNHGM